ncbi:MAG: hypothetical protein H6654_13155 [Ardenticatenaceae bacterium]|nr:hypothetical protein [Anaerolineales bacterium]MCB8941605.1 hypothetical protein [Ardenticatenaceae bacterium]MCB8974500.1 hypothetical protein [Ardenticatenaceae bacterium]
MSSAIMPLFWVAFALIILLIMQRWIHTHLHGISLLLMGKPERAIILYAIVLLPGVFLHELSHWLAATFLGVRTGSFSIIPKMQPDGTVQLGYVEYYKGSTLGPIRESIIGGAPLIMGTAVILLIGFRVFSVTQLTAAFQSGELDALITALEQVYQTPDFLLWLYLLFAIANGMMPSRSDRRAWPAFLLTLFVTLVILALLGWTGVIIDNLAGPAATVLGYLGLALSMAIGVNVLFMALIAGFEGMAGRAKGVSVVYGPTDSA